MSRDSRLEHRGGGKTTASTAHFGFLHTFVTSSSQPHTIRKDTTRGVHSPTISDSGAVSVRRHRRACLQLLLQLGLRRDELLGAGTPATDSLLQLLRASRCGFNSESSSSTHMKGGGRGLRAGGSALTCSAARVATSSSRSCCAESIDHRSGPSVTVSHPADDIRSESDASRFCAASRSSWAAASPSLASVCARLSLAFSVVRRSSSSCCGVGPGAGTGAALFLLDLTSRCGTTTVLRSGRNAIRTPGQSLGR